MTKPQFEPQDGWLRQCAVQKITELQPVEARPLLGEFLYYADIESV